MPELMLYVFEPINRNNKNMLAYSQVEEKHLHLNKQGKYFV